MQLTTPDRCLIIEKRGDFLNKNKKKRQLRKVIKNRKKAIIKAAWRNIFVNAGLVEK